MQLSIELKRPTILAVLNILPLHNKSNRPIDLHHTYSVEMLSIQKEAILFFTPILSFQAYSMAVLQPINSSNTNINQYHPNTNTTA